ncbi:HNH endonuclease [Acanthopleuribacter pedis]|uniref:HNH endonuclease n=1 Tax=Acanthopleuribacter pedis TaxID=442870 RepID=A0A8J7U4T2_9BACT|nr:HNH endonuclease [Acanthopleuribacter pedis]MBO1319783.1 HNH endonuclease [Acanthopleuribacter pedis]
MICIYCNEQKEEKEFSLEHIFPDALGGALMDDNIFKTRQVCRRCNSISGRFVDGLFIKSWLSVAARAESSRKYLDLERGSALPFTYAGRMQGIELEDGMDCDYWIGPNGDRVYHVHEAYDERSMTYVSGNPITRKKKPGIAVLFPRNNEQKWLQTVFKSFVANFKKAKRYLGTPNDGLGPLLNTVFHEILSEDRQLVETLREKMNQEHHVRISMEEGFEQRFLAKVALGLGFQIFGEKFLNSSYATSLRNAFWEKDFKERQAKGVIFKSRLRQEDCPSALKELFWPGAHTIWLIPSGQYLILGIFLFGSEFYAVVISDEPEVWRGSELTSGINGFIVVPQIDKFVGPISSSEFLAHQHGVELSDKLKPLDEIRQHLDQQVT